MYRYCCRREATRTAEVARLRVRESLTVLCSVLVVTALLSTRVIAADAPAFPAKERLNTLFIAPPHGYDGTAAAECMLLESLCDVRFTAVQVPHRAGDHMADVDGHFGADERWIPIRKAEILRQLQRSYDAVLVGAAVADGEVQQALTRYVTGGGALVWLAGDKAPEWLAGALKVGAAAPAVPDPLAGLGLAAAGMKPAGRGKLLTDGLTVLHAIPGGKAPTPLATYGTVGKGRVLALPSMFPVTFAPGIDGDWLWAQAFERLVRFAVKGRAAPAVTLKAEPAAPDAPPAVEQKVRVTLTGPAGAVVALRQSDMRGAGRELAQAVALKAEPVTVEVMLDAAMGGPVMIEAMPTAGAAASGLTFLTLPAPVALDVYTIRQGNLPDFKTQSALEIVPAADCGKATLHWTVLDWAHKAVAYRAEAVELKAGIKVEKTFDYTLTDPDPRAYVSWLRVHVTDAQGRVLARPDSALPLPPLRHDRAIAGGHLAHRLTSRPTRPERSLRHLPAGLRVQCRVRFP